MGSRCGCLTVAGLVLLIRAAPAFAADPKTDVIELLNGDRITCEIRKLERGKLTVKTDGIGTISIEWNDVAHVTSTSNYEVELNSGERHVGSLARGDAKTILVLALTSADRLVMENVVRISPLRGGFWHKLDGSIDAGFNFTQANVQTQWTFDTSVNYRSRYWLSTLDADSSLTTREDAARQTRNNLTLQSERFLRARWSAVGFVQFQQNEELSLQLRSVIGGGIKHVLAQSNRTVFAAVAGAAYANEQYEAQAQESVAEAVAGANWAWFTFDGRSTNLDVSLITFYGLNKARTRFELNTTFKSDIVGDLYWSINLFESYNSSPPSGQKTNDFGVSAAVGWSF